jgi:ribosomally synthesized peptide (two-chain TOMM family)
MQFRLLYLRAIAHAWIDPDFRKKLVDEKSAGGVVGHLATRFPKEPWPWPGTVDLRIEDSPQFLWTGSQWFWPQPSKEDRLDEIRLLVPRRPKGKNGAPIPVEKHGIALADYYRVRPSLLGHGPSVASGGGATVMIDARKLSAAGPMASLAATPLESDAAGGVVGGFIPSSGSFLDFNVALLSVIAKAWENENFAKVLVVDPIASLQTVHQYSPPWKLDIHIQYDEHAYWDEADEQTPWHHLPQHVITLHLPEPPRDSKDHPIALAAYNATGAEYPFTCCAC